MKWEMTKASLLAGAFKTGWVLLSKLSDQQLAALAHGLASVVRDAAMRTVLDEVESVLRSGPPQTTVVRRVLDRSRFEELRDYVWGSLYVKPMREERRA
jgi:hypothetical protein